MSPLTIWWFTVHFPNPLPSLSLLGHTTLLLALRFKTFLVFLYIFWPARGYWPLVCLCRPLVILRDDRFEPRELAAEGLYWKRPIQCPASSKYWPPHPLTAPWVCTPPPPPLVWGENALAGWIGGGGSIFWKTPDTALYSTYVSTLWSLPYQLSHQAAQLYRVAD